MIEKNLDSASELSRKLLLAVQALRKIVRLGDVPPHLSTSESMAEIARRTLESFR